jgi:hypothetical protein
MLALGRDSGGLRRRSLHRHVVYARDRSVRPWADCGSRHHRSWRGRGRFFGAWAANRSTAITDKREREAAEATDKREREAAEATDKREREAAQWARLQAWQVMACSNNPKEAVVGMRHLEKEKRSWSAEQRKVIESTLEALLEEPVQAYHQGQTNVVPVSTGTPDLSMGAST